MSAVCVRCGEPATTYKLIRFDVFHDACWLQMHALEVAAETIERHLEGNEARVTVHALRLLAARRAVLA